MSYRFCSNADVSLTEKPITTVPEFGRDENGDYPIEPEENITVTVKVVLFGIDDDDDDDDENPAKAERVRILTDAESASLPPKRCVKTVHIHSYIHYMAQNHELEQLTSLLQSREEIGYGTDIDCTLEGYVCNLRVTVGPEIGLLSDKDAVIFGMDEQTWAKKPNLLRSLLGQEPRPGQTWIYYSTSSPLTRKVNITHLKYHTLMTYDSKSDIHIPFGYYRRFNGTSNSSVNTQHFGDELYNRTGFTSWMDASCDRAFWPRRSFVQELKKLLSLDDYGHCGTKKCLTEGNDGCDKLFASYKFSLVLPVEECHDQILESFWKMLFKYGTVPVVLGAPREDYVRWAPPNSFVYAGDFDSLPKLVSFLKKVNSDDALYRKYHAWRKEGEVVLTYPWKPSILCKTLPYIYERKYKYIGDSPWYKGCRILPNSNPADGIIEDDYKNWTMWR